jgi:hypothetical protein
MGGKNPAEPKGFIKSDHEYSSSNPDWNKFLLNFIYFSGALQITKVIFFQNWRLTQKLTNIS